MSNLLKDLKNTDLPMAEKVKLYNDCNRQRAILCKHKRTVGAAHETQMEKFGDRIKGRRYLERRHKMMMLNIEPKEKKKRGAAFFEKEERA